AACCVYVRDQPVVDIWGGRTTADGHEPYAERTLQMVASATKGALAICAHRLVQQGQLDLDAPVADYWPEFAAAGKELVPVRWLLSHQAGLPVVDADVTIDDVIQWDPVIAALARTRPVWEPGTAHGYHAVTYGWLVGEVIARVTGRSPGSFFTAEVAEPLGLDFHIGLPDSERGRVSPLRPAALLPEFVPDALALRIADPTSLAYRAFLVQSGLPSALNDPAVWRAEIPAANGMATAHALARMYAACLGEVDGVRLLEPDTLAAATALQAEGVDVIAGYDTRYALGFQLAFPYRPMAGPGSFGHYGLGGSVGFAHPGHGLSFGYTVNQMAPGTPADPRSVALIKAVVGCLN
ncbi:MAG: beta-lactamase family protein, partial [Actinomycetota bacterium]|nr:beta-lactamase family protein [Actinomycetota bacterium]